jgi:hypothetical protein
MTLVYLFNSSLLYLCATFNRLSRFTAYIMDIPNRSSAFITSHSATIQLSANIGIAIINSGSAHIQSTHNIGIIFRQQFTATKCHSRHKGSLPYVKSTASSGNTRNIGRTLAAN